MTTQVTQVHRWTRDDYDRMVLCGLFQPHDRVELIDGEIVDVTPQSSLHSTGVLLAVDALRPVYAQSHDVRTLLPLAVDDESEPEPDVAVVPGTPRDYKDEHPTSAVLVVEVADSSLSYDRDRKKRTYARAGIPEYWIVNLLDNCLEVHRDPLEDSYEVATVLHSGQTVSPLSCPHASIAVSDLLP